MEEKINCIVELGDIDKLNLVKSFLVSCIINKNEKDFKEMLICPYTNEWGLF